MARAKSRNTRRIESLKADNARMEDALRQQMRDTNPLFQEIEKLGHSREFVLSMARLHFSLDFYIKMVNAISPIIYAQIPQTNFDEEEKQLVLEASRRFFEDVVTARKMVESMKAKT